LCHADAFGAAFSRPSCNVLSELSLIGTRRTKAIFDREHRSWTPSNSKTNLQGAFHNSGATKGVCVDCHKKANAENFKNDVEFAAIRDRQAETDQLQRWLKEHEADTWAPVKYHDCHQKPPAK
jgi:hypothetical protein